MNGLLVMSDDEILYTSIMSFRNLADSTSNGVDMNSMPALSQCFFSASNSPFQNLSCRVNNSNWLLVGSLVVSQYAGESLDASVAALYVWNLMACAPPAQASSTRRRAMSMLPSWFTPASAMMYGRWMPALRAHTGLVLNISVRRMVVLLVVAKWGKVFAVGE